MTGDRVVEHEVIEQLASDPVGMPLQRLCDFVRQRSRAQPLPLLREMWVAGYVELRDERGRVLLAWECADVFRSGEETRLVRVNATPHGTRSLRE